MTNSLLARLFLGAGLAFTGCDTRGEITLHETEISGPVKIKLIQEVQTAHADDYIIEISDSEDNLRLKFKSNNLLHNGTRIVGDDGSAYTVRDGKRFYEQVKIFKKPDYSDK